MFVEWLKKNRDSITSFNKNIFPDINNRSKWENIPEDFKDFAFELFKKNIKHNFRYIKEVVLFVDGKIPFEKEIKPDTE